jgi:hypothetical protein
MTVYIVLSVETHFTGVVSGVQSNIRLERAFLTPERADLYRASESARNPKSQYTVERMEVRSDL